jgi:enamine deaminase RidA (YjgF/YER057c/UK114 family)
VHLQRRASDDVEEAELADIIEHVIANQTGGRKAGVSHEAARVWETCAMEPKTITLVRSDDLSNRAPYAYAAMPPVGARLVFTAGACPIDADGETVAPGDVAAQAEHVMKNLRTALRAAGADLDNVVKTTVYVATQQQEDLRAVWEVVRRHFGSHDAPSTLLGVSVLGYRDQLVEVEAVAALA